MAYQRKRKNYSELSDVKLPKSRKTVPMKQDEKLYAIEVIEENDTQVKIHYTGFGSEHDEWRNREDVVPPKELERYKPFDHHQLVYAIKSALYSGRDRDPSIRVEVPFDKLVFQGGLKSVRKLQKVVRDEEHYGITHHEDLTPFLGERWFIRGINAHFDFCCALADTVTFYLHKKPQLVGHLATTGKLIDGGYVLVFKFVRFDGVKEQLPNFDIEV